MGGLLRRVIAYIDGFNLYFGLKDSGWKRYYWLDLWRLVERLMQPDQQLIELHYFTARISGARGNSADSARQTTYLDALQTISGISIHEGHYLTKKRVCRRCGNHWPEPEEKMTDVNIAVRLLADAFDDRFDTAIIISADSDLVPPMHEIRSRFSEKRIVVPMPPRRHSRSLANLADVSFQIGEANIRKSQLPERIQTETGFILQRPATWK
jgi:uncharacterized LabA/DUF88 family protein